MRFFIFLFLSLFILKLYPYTEKPMVVVIPSYNNAQWYKKNLESVFNQNYSNFRVIYIDDESTDNTAALVEDYIKEKQYRDKMLLIKNSKRVTAMENIYKAIHLYCEDNDIVVKLDGDDWFAHDNVLSRINQEYQDASTWATYGNYIDYPNPFPNEFEFCKQVNFNESMRNPTTCGFHTPGHPFTFYSSLFKQIKFKHILYNGELPKVGYDGFMNFPMFEMGLSHIKYIRDILYIHNVFNPINDYKINASSQREIGLFNMARKPYKKLENLISNQINHIDVLFMISEKDSLIRALNELKKYSFIKNIYIVSPISEEYISTFNSTNKSDYILVIKNKYECSIDDIKKAIKALRITQADFLSLNPKNSDIKWNSIDNICLFKCIKDIPETTSIFEENFICKKSKLSKFLNKPILSSLKKDQVIISI